MDLQILDMAGARPEHSVVIVNFVSAIRKQLKNSTCFVFPDNVQYKMKLKDGSEKVIIPDASINCMTKARKGNTFLEIPRFVMEVLSPSTEKYDRGEKMELYRKQEIDEYWIVDWEKRKVEIYNLDYDENGIPQYYLFKIVTKENKEEILLFIQRLKEIDSSSVNTFNSDFFYLGDFYVRNFTFKNKKRKKDKR